jgi:acetylornithine deacetylase/succinyl-diaminopimelate desuccinylase-like protein
MNIHDLRSAVARDMQRTEHELERLVRIPSIAFPGFDAAPVHDSAVATAEILEAAGVNGVRLMELPDGVDHPAVFGEIAGPEGAPTILLYAHHDVQPEGPLEEWDSPPFEPVVRDGRMFGRGTSDDKCGIVLHAAAIRAWSAHPPIGVKILVEGEEEAGTDHLPFLIQENAELIRSDVAIIADSGNWRRGMPTLTTTLRGVVDCRVEVRVLEKAVHSGSYGGPIPDALTSLSRLLATLHDDRGDVAIGGLTAGAWNGVEYDENALREEAGVLDGVEWIGTGSLAERLWTRPAASVLGIDAPRVREASNQLVPVATAKVSLRIPPGQPADGAMEALVSHLETHAPWGVRVRVERGTGAEPFAVEADGPAFVAARDALAEAWGRETVDMGSGGSIPLVPMLASTFPGIAVLMLGPADELAAAHSVNESVALDELERCAVAEASLFDRLAKPARVGRLSG